MRLHNRLPVVRYFVFVYQSTVRIYVEVYGGDEIHLGAAAIIFVASQRLDHEERRYCCPFELLRTRMDSAIVHTMLPHKVIRHQGRASEY